MVDVHPTKLKHTWMKIRTGEGRVEKRLDGFSINEELLEKNLIFIQWGESRGDLDHLPICMEVLGALKKPPNSFKLCASYLKEEEVSDIIKTTSTPFNPDEGSFATPHFVKTLTQTKKKIKEWAFKK